MRIVATVVFTWAWGWIFGAAPACGERAAAQSVEPLRIALAERTVTPATDAAGAPLLPVLASEPTLDGRPDEPAWRGALAWALSYEREVKLNEPAGEPTLFLIGRTEDALWLAFVCADRSPRSLRATLADRGTAPDNQDHVRIDLDTFGDERHAIRMAVNPLNVQSDSLVEDRGEEDPSFDFPWSSAAALGPDGWTVEIRVPLATLRYASGGAVWRVAPERSFPRAFTYRFGPVAWDPDRNCALCQSPAVRVDLAAGSARALQLIPYAIGLADDPAEGPRRNDYDGGLDLKWQPRPGWVVDAALNPDFRQVESDAFQITSNLRFAPFVDERRPFFFERSDLFRTPLQTVYTRTLLDPQAGLRATGKFGRNAVALLATRDRATFLQFPGPIASSSAVLADVPSDNALLRWRYDLGAQSRLGFLYTDKTFAEGANRTLSLDGRFGVGKDWLLETQFVGSRTSYPRAIAADNGQADEPFGGGAGWLKLRKDGRTWEHRYELDVRGADLRADLGYLPQVGIKKFTVTEWYHGWPESGPVKDWGGFLEGHYTVAGERTLESQVWIGGNATLPGETYLELGYAWNRAPIGLPGGGLDRLIASERLLFYFDGSPSRFYLFRGKATAGTDVDFVLGERVDSKTLRLFQEWRLLRRVTASLLIDGFEFSQGATVEDALVASVRIEVQLTPRFGLRQLVQRSRFRFPDPRFAALGFPREQGELEIQSLVRWRLDYGSALFVGFFSRESLGQDGPGDRGAFVKLSWRFQL